MILSAKEIEFSYGSRTILAKVGFSVQRGEFLSILGNNGAGKSTLLKTLNRILLPKKGSVLLDNREVSELSRLAIALKMAYVAQNYASSRQTVFDAVLLGRKPHIKWEARASDLALVQEVLARTGLEKFALRYLDELSGGELQKVVIARALAQEPEVLLLDEPTSNLDLKNQIEVLRTIQTAAKEKNIAVVAVMHDLNLALRFSDKFLLLQNTKVFAAGGLEVMTAENISQAYGVPVSVERIGKQRVVIPS